MSPLNPSQQVPFAVAVTFVLIASSACLAGDREPQPPTAALPPAPERASTVAAPIDDESELPTNSSPEKRPIDRDPFTWRCTDTSGQSWEADAKEAIAWTHDTQRATMALFREGTTGDELGSGESSSDGRVSFIPMSEAARGVLRGCLQAQLARYPHVGGSVHFRVASAQGQTTHVCAGPDGAFDHAMLDCTTRGLVSIGEAFLGASSHNGWRRGLLTVRQR